MVPDCVSVLTDENTNEKMITMKVVRTRGVGTLVLTNRTGNFYFSNSGAAFVSIKKAVQKAMTYVGYSWLRDLLLGHNNNALRLTNPLLLNAQWLHRFPPLNDEQAIGLARATDFGGSLSQMVTLVEGPPGTGKTGLIAKIVMDCIESRQKWLLVAETMYALQICAQRLHQELPVYGDSSQRIFVIGRYGIEDADFAISAADAPDAPEGGPWTPSFYSTTGTDGQLSEQARRKTVQLLKQTTQGRIFSLTSHINERRGLLETSGRGFSPDERRILEQLNSAQANVENLNTDTAQHDDLEDAYKWFDRSYFDAREYYISRHARGIICTAATCTGKLFRYFNPSMLILEEGSQLSEPLAVAIISRNLTSLRKTVFVGDINQNGVFTFDDMSEFSSTMAVSLMERLMKSGVPYTRLQEQYRMHPHISAAVSKHFYSGQLKNSPSVFNRPQDAIWSRFCSLAFPKYPLRHSYFVHSPCPEVYRSKKSRSLVNPSHLHYIPNVINLLRQAGAADTQIAYMSFYRGQLGLMRTWETPGMTMSTVDQAHGREYDFVLLDTVTTGGNRVPLGFTADPRRMCVALSRARIGLIIFGHQEMWRIQHPNAGSKIWKSIIQDHLQNKAVSVQQKPNLAEVLERHQIPGNLWEEAVPGT